MAGLGLALMNAASGYMRGREQRRQGEVEDQRYADQRARQAEQDARAREMMAAQVEQMRAAQQERAAASARQAEMDQRNAYEGGYRPQSDVGRMGEALNVGPSPTVGAVGGAMQSVGAMGDAMRSAARAPSAFTLGGAPMVKSAESTTETRDNRAMAMQDARAREQRAQELADAEAARNFQRSQQDRSFQQQRSMLDTRMDNAPQPKLRVVPAGTMKDFQGINANLRELQDIEAALTKDPQTAGEALGLRNMLPEWVATRGMSEPALTLRGKLSNVASGIFLERSGAAVTPSEAKRLEGWTANLTDNPTKALNAIRNMRAFYEQKVQDMQGAYGAETGYHPLAPMGQPAPQAPRQYTPGNPFAPRGTP